MPWWWRYTEAVSPRPLHLHRISSLGSNVGATHSLKPHALRRTAANRIDVACRLGVRTTAACRLFPSGEALPSTTSAGSCLPLFGRFLGTTTSSDFSPTSTQELAYYLERGRKVIARSRVALRYFQQRLAKWDCEGLGGDDVHMPSLPRHLVPRAPMEMNRENWSQCSKRRNAR